MAKTKNQGKLKVQELEPTTLPPPDPKRVTTTLDKPIGKEAKETVAAALVKELGVTREEFLADLGKAARRRG